jgi:nitrate/nitrite transporter NarK
MSRLATMLTLVIAGEIIFGLPFHLGRFFRPTLLDTLGFTNTQLGDVFAVYGVLAMLAYFPGGFIADRFPAKNLLMVSLVATGAGGFYMATYPGQTGMAVLYAYWGVSTILLFWAALIRATREWGGADTQGAAFGILDGGRGLVAAAFASIAILAFAWAMPGNPETLTNEERRAAFRVVILLYSGGAIAAGALAWFVLPATSTARLDSGRLFGSLGAVVKRPLIWAQAGIIVCAYSAFKGLDNYSLYAEQVLGFHELDAAKLAAAGGYVRPVAAVAVGLLADRYKSSTAILVSFAVLTVSYTVFAYVTPGTTGLSLIYANALVSLFAVFGLRGVYFALLEENRTPDYMTGAAAGMVSFVGYTPEIFFSPITGRILDANPGIKGHQNYFLFLACISIIGMAVAGWMLWLRRRNTDTYKRLSP